MPVRRFAQSLISLLAVAVTPTALLAEDGAVRRVELRDAVLAQSEAGRKTLGYLIDCALPAGVVATTEVDGVTYEFPGAMGLAPGWLDQPSTRSEQRWVSACMLARTNYFGTKVRISMRAPGSGFASLETSEAERRDYTLYEGAFFGNLFAEGTPAFLCLGEAVQSTTRDPIFEKRVCTEPHETEPGMTRCGLRSVGFCASKSTFEANGEIYREVIQVWLKPATAAN